MAKAGEAVVLKTDALGRVKMTAAQRERVLDEFERSGLSGAKFAKLAGIKYQTFATLALGVTLTFGRPADPFGDSFLT